MKRARRRRVAPSSEAKADCRGLWRAGYSDGYRLKLPHHDAGKAARYASNSRGTRQFGSSDVRVRPPMAPIRPGSEEISKQLIIEGYKHDWRPDCGLRLGPHSYNLEDEMHRIMDRIVDAARG